MMRCMISEHRRSSRWNIAGVILLALATIMTSPTGALAQEADVQTDGRLEGYPQSVTIEGSTALTWFLLVILALVTLSVMFKDAKRSHLD